jgi:hypothetical protein
LLVLTQADLSGRELLLRKMMPEPRSAGYKTLLYSHRGVVLSLGEGNATTRFHQSR